MKLTTVVLLSTCLHVAASGSAQKVTISLKDVSIQKVFEEVLSQTRVSIIYDESYFENARPVSIKVKDATPGEVIKLCLSGLPFTFTEEKNSIVISPIRALHAELDERHLSGPLLDPPPIKISGTIVGIDNQPLVGATIKVKGTNITAVTDDNGYFELNAEAGSTLIISYVGFAQREYKVNNNTPISISLLQLDVRMDTAEVVISTGYQTIHPERFVGSAVVVDSTILERQVGRDIFSRLDGTTNGLLFRKAGPGYVDVQLRGVSTLNTNKDLNGLSSQNPLIILDDFPFTGDVNTINPNDIENISVLKDAAAASIWGARAGNGVIVIKTKRAKKNSGFTVSFSSNVSITEKPDLYYFPQMTSSEYIDVESFLFNKGYYDIYLQFPQFFKTTPAVEILDKIRDDPGFATEGNARLKALRAIDVRNDFNNYFFKEAVNYQNFLSLSQSSDVLNYKVSLGADNNLSNIQGPGRNDRYTFNSFVGFRANKHLLFSVGVDYINEKIKHDAAGIGYPLSTGNNVLYPYASLADENGNHLAVPYNHSASYLETLTGDQLLDWYYRPLDELKMAKGVSKKNLLRINLGGNLRLAPWLTADAKYQYSEQQSDIHDLRSIETYFARNLINQYTNPTTFDRAIPIGGILNISSATLSSHHLRGQLNVNKSWSSLHEFTAILGAEMSETVGTSNGHTRYGYDDNTGSFATQIDYKDSYPQFSGGSQKIPVGLSMSEQRSNLVSILGNASYTYDKRYGIYASARRDGSNIFGVNTNNKFKPLWSAGVRWNISRESFYHLNWMEILTLRASYGYSGNVNNSVSALSTIYYSSRLSDFNEPYVSPGTPPNPELRWEVVKMINLGLDFGLFKNRISGNLEFWRKKAKDVVDVFPLDPTLGFTSSLYKNVANLNGKGVDLAINTKNIIGKFGWLTTININYAKTVVSKYYNDFKTTPNTPSIREGDIYTAHYAYKWAGLDPLTGDPRGYIGKEVSVDYRGIFNDDFSNQVYIGPAFPVYFGNVMNTFSYAGISVSANISFRADYYFRRPAIKYQDLFRGAQYHSDYRLRWQNPGDEKVTNVPSMTYPANNNRDRFYEFAEVNYEKGDHIRLQDIRVSYDVINKRRYKALFKSIRLYAYAGNINLMIWKASKSEFDPDYSTSIFPLSRSYAFGLNIGL